VTRSDTELIATQNAHAPLAAPKVGIGALLREDSAVPKRVIAFRQVATKFLLWEEWLTLLPIFIVGYYADVSLLAIAAIGGGFSLLSTIAYRSDPTGLLTRYSLAVGLLVNVLLTIYALSSFGSWQLDGGHMWIFAVWSHCLAMLCWRSLAVSGFFGVLHHFILIYLVPVYVFPDGANLGRVALHGAVVVAQLGVLTIFIFLMFRMLWLAENLERSLQRTADELKDVNQSKSRFLTMMSHELRTPLNAIIGFSEMMKLQALGPIENPSYLGYTEDIHKSGIHLLAIINDILDLSKVESGKLVLKQELVDAAALTADCQHLIKGIANEHGVKLMAPTVPQGLKVLADVRLMKQMLINLMTNACKYTPAGGEVRLAWREDAEGIWASVVDTGIGMSQVDIDIAMQPFGQVDNPFVRSREGTGLGLPLVKELIATHGGRLDILSRPGAGSTISLILPRPEAVAA